MKNDSKYILSYQVAVGFDAPRDPQDEGLCLGSISASISGGDRQNRGNEDKQGAASTTDVRNRLLCVHHKISPYSASDYTLGSAATTFSVSVDVSD